VLLDREVALICFVVVERELRGREQVREEELFFVILS
jgi:hypothetical protein